MSERPQGMERSGRTIARALLVATLLAVPSLAGAAGPFAAAVHRAVQDAGGGPAVAELSPLSLTAIASSPLVASPGSSSYGPAPGAVAVEAAPGTPVQLSFTLPYRNASELAADLGEINDPGSPQYHRYLSRPEFTDEFAPNASSYATLVAYVSGFDPSALTTYPDRLALTVTASPSDAAAMLHTGLERVGVGNLTYWATVGTAELPAVVAQNISSVGGLGPASAVDLSPLAGVEGARVPTVSAAPSAGGALAPVTNGSVQYLYPSDLQWAYDEESLFELYGYPAGASIAVIVGTGVYEGSAGSTSCGPLTPGESLGPYDPADLSSFFANTTPVGEPISQVVNVSVDGAAPPDCRASYDGTGVVAANTAELEAAGELAPGATVYAVSVPGQPSVGELGTALATILDPPSTLPRAVRAGLDNVSAVAIGWAAEDAINVTWLGEMQEASALGVSVVAGTGNSADNPHSPAWNGTDTSFPASAANDTAGALAVGGTTLTLNASTDQIADEVVWNDSTVEAPLGTAGGVSPYYAEPAFQRNTSAQLKIAGVGRGLPDLAAVANNTLVTLTVNGSQYRATNATDGGPFRFAYGTGVAAAVVTGLVAEIDHVLTAANNSRLGFVDPELYAVANEQYTAAPNGDGIVSSPSGAYDSELPTAPFHDVTSGRNDVTTASVGYDLVTGWGSLDAYNYTMYVLSTSAVGVYGTLDGIRDRVHFTGLQATSKLPGGAVDHQFNASVQQDFFLANSMGAPVYGAQGVVDLARTSAGDWNMNFSAWLDYPFRGFYPAQVVQEDDWSHIGGGSTLPLTISITTRLVSGSAAAPAQLIFTFQGAALSLALTLNVPGASYIIGRTGYSYSWQGTTYEDGPTADGSAFGYLAPQLDLVGGAPSSGAATDTQGSFGLATSGNFTAAVVPAGASVFTPAEIGTVTSANRQTSASATNLTYLASSDGGCNVTYSAGATGQGAYQVEAPFYPVEFTQTGVPDGASWYVNLTGGFDLAGAGSTDALTATLQNGTYGWTAAIDLASWAATPDVGTVTVQGKAIVVALSFAPGFGTVTFDAKGPETDGQLNFVWYVNISGQPPHNGTSVSYEVTLATGSYTYKVTCAEPNYVASRPSGTVTIGAAPVVVDEGFSVRTYAIEFEFQLPKSNPHLTISMGGISDSGVFSTWTLNEPNGSYGWSISGLPFGYGAVPGQGVVNVHGPVKPIVVKVGTTGWGPFDLGIIGYVLVLVLVGFAAVWSTVFLLRRRRRRRERRAAAASAVPAAPAPAAGAAKPARRPDRGPRRDPP